MNIKHQLLLLLSAILLSLTQPLIAAAVEDIIVEQTPTSGHFATIQGGIVEAQRRIAQNTGESFRVLVRPGTYSGAIIPINNVPIVGSSTAATFLNGTGTAVSLSGNNNVTISNFTFQNGASISVAGSSSIVIQNIVFNFNGVQGTAVSVVNSPTTSIINNTFFRAAVAIRTDSELNAITNNIFYLNTTAISAPSLLSHPTYNAFYQNSTNGISTVNPDPNTLPNQSHPGLDPLFVNPPNDFHLQAGSPAKGTGNPSPSYLNRNSTTSDMGAYGGPNADLPAPATVTGVTSTLTAPDTITVSWNPSTDSSVNFYRVYYGTISAATSGSNGYNGTGATEGSSPVLVPKTSNSANLSKIPVVPAIAAPTNVHLAPLDRALQVTWSPVADATRYLVYYSTSSFDGNSLPANRVLVAGTTTRATIENLINLTPYFVRVQAVADNQVFIAVTAVNDNNVSPAAGSSNESAYSAETSQSIGAVVTSELSAASPPEFPEAASPFPNVKKGGCFIATAAYGFYSAPQVQALRIFRDRYLMTNPLGRAFVAWYYKYGPIGARFITEHPWLKVPVRVALFPLVLMALFLIYVPLPAKGAMLCALVLGAAFYWRSQQRRLPVQQGGML